MIAAMARAANAVDVEAGHTGAAKIEQPTAKNCTNNGEQDVDDRSPRQSC
jgi:hypothetical protein